MRFRLVLREYLGGPLDGQLEEHEGSPPAFLLGPRGRYVLSAWQLPVATYRWRPNHAS